MATKVSDADIKAYVQQNINNPAAIAAAAAANGVSIADLARATNFSAEQVNGYFANAKVDTKALTGAAADTSGAGADTKTATSNSTTTVTKAAGADTGYNAADIQAYLNSPAGKQARPGVTVAQFVDNELINGRQNLSKYLPAAEVNSMTDKQILAANELYYQGGGSATRKDNGLTMADIDWIRTKANDYNGAVNSPRGQAVTVPGDDKVLTGRIPLDANYKFDTSGYTGQTGASDGGGATNKANLSGYNSVTTRGLVESTLGYAIDDYFYDQSNPNYAKNMSTLQRAIKVQYSDVGANQDWRNWNAIMSSKDPLKAAEDALILMYNDKAYLASNADKLLAQGYLPEQADFTYQQMADRVGSTYDSTWTKGTKFDGKLNTATYLSNMSSMNPADQERYLDSLWAQWGGNPAKKTTATNTTTTTGTNVNNTAGTNTATTTGTGGTAVSTAAGDTGIINSAIVGSTGGTTGTAAATDTTAINTPGADNLTAGSQQGTAGVTGAQVVYGPDGKEYASAAAAKAAGVTNYTYTKPLFGASSTTQPGLLAGADTLKNPYTLPATQTGDVNPSGLIATTNKQLYSGKAKINLPAGVTNPFGV
jgi:hypothetical protein